MQRLGIAPGMRGVAVRERQPRHGEDRQGDDSHDDQENVEILFHRRWG